MGNDFYLTMSRALSAMLLLLGVLCAVSAVDPDKGNPNLGPDMARTMYAEWKQQSAAHLQDVHDQISTGQWPQMDGGYIIIDDFHLNGARRAVLEYRAQHNILDTIIPVPEDYVFSCGQHVEHEYHSWPKKIPQGAYWKKGGFRSHIQ